MTPVFANFACGLGGFLAGMLLWVVVWRWVGLIYTTIHSKGLRWFTPVVAVLHPAMWMLAGFAYLVYRVSTRPMPTGWTWLIAGMLAGLAVQVLLMMWAWRRIRAKIAKPPQAP